MGGVAMFKRPVNPRISESGEDLRTSRIVARRGGFRFHLPSPFVLSIVVVFVILPLVWPESDEIASAPDLLASFDLSADVCALAISPDASRMAAACRDESITLWRRSREHEWSPSLL